MDNDELEEKLTKIRFLSAENLQNIRYLLTEISEECTKTYFISVLSQLSSCLAPLTSETLKKVNFDYIGLMGLARCFLLAFDFENTSKYDTTYLSMLVFETSIFFFVYVLKIGKSDGAFDYVLNISKRLFEFVKNKKMLEILLTPIKKKQKESVFCFQVQDKTEMIDELIVKFSSRVVWLKNH